jgi:hypothetical protein
MRSNNIETKILSSQFKYYDGSIVLINIKRKVSNIINNVIYKHNERK